jgi:hypothetical protein
MVTVDLLTKQQPVQGGEEQHVHVHTVYLPGIDGASRFAMDWVTDSEPGERKAVLYTPGKDGLKVTVVSTQG